MNSCGCNPPKRNFKVSFRPDNTIHGAKDFYIAASNLDEMIQKLNELIDKNPINPMGKDSEIVLRLNRQIARRHTLFLSEEFFGAHIEKKKSASGNFLLIANEHSMRNNLSSIIVEEITLI